MKCTSCGSEIGTKNICPVCGANSANTKKKTNTVYTGLDEMATPVYTRSRLVALILAFMGGNDLYLFYWSRFFWKIVLIFVTFGIGYLIWQIIDIINIATGRMKYDAHGNPIEW